MAELVLWCFFDFLHQNTKGPRTVKLPVDIICFTGFDHQDLPQAWWSLMNETLSVKACKINDFHWELNSVQTFSILMQLSPFFVLRMCIYFFWMCAHYPFSFFFHFLPKQMLTIHNIDMRHYSRQKLKVPWRGLNILEVSVGSWEVFYTLIMYNYLCLQSLQIDWILFLSVRKIGEIINGGLSSWIVDYDQKIKLLSCIHEMGYCHLAYHSQLLQQLMSLKFYEQKCSTNHNRCFGPSAEHN